MEIPVHLSCKGVELTPDQEALIRDAVAKLERFFDRLVACHVVVSVPNRRPGGEPVAWTVRMALTVPGGELADHPAGQADFPGGARRTRSTLPAVGSRTTPGNSEVT